MEEVLNIVAAVNSDDVLRENLLSSPDVGSGAARVIAERGHACAGAAYNAGLAKTDAEVVALVHQDVYLPAGWIDRLGNAIAEIERNSGSWGILGVWGVCADGAFAGRAWCSGGNCEHKALSGIQLVASIDEIVIVMNNRHGLRFDNRLPGYHMYATDIILQARQQGLKAFVFDAPVIHNSRCNLNVYDSAYRSAYRYMQRKWKDELPLLTCVAPITRQGHWGIRKRWLKAEARKRLGVEKWHPRPRDPVELARRLGYEEDHRGILNAKPC